MIKNVSIVCIALTAWERSFTNTIIKIMTLLSKDNTILFVDYQNTLKDVVNGIRGKKEIPIRRVLGMEGRLRKITTEIGTEIYVLTCPPVLPINWISNDKAYQLLLNLNASIVKRTVKKAMKEINMENPIVINGYHPFLGLPLAGAFNEKLNVYYCYDEIKGDIWFKRHGAKVEEKYLKKTDVVITTSDALHASKSISNPNCYVVKNGVDFDLFNSVAWEVKSQKNVKVVGYTGSIDERFDAELMSYVIKKLPDVKFYFVGRIGNEEARKIMVSSPNVKFFGGKSPEEVPAHLKEIDVCIIPYLKNDVTRGVYPLKINEYLAAGKPVVMTDFSEFPEFGNMVSIAHNKEEFVQLLKQELHDDTQVKKMNRIEMARLNSWENRVEEFSFVLKKYIDNQKFRSDIKEFQIELGQLVNDLKDMKR